MIEKGDINPTIPPTKRYISERKLVEGIKSIQDQAERWLARLEREGSIKLNPNGGIGKPKYILAHLAG